MTNLLLLLAAISLTAIAVLVAPPGVLRAAMEFVGVVEEQPLRPCICGHHVQPGEPARWSPGRDRLIHDWCMPVEVTLAGEWGIQSWLDQQDELERRGD